MSIENVGFPLRKLHFSIEILLRFSTCLSLFTLISIYRCSSPLTASKPKLAATNIREIQNKREIKRLVTVDGN